MPYLSSFDLLARQATPAASPPPPPPVLTVRLTMAPPFFGNNFACILLGLLLAQTYTYYISFKNDNPWLKAFVYSSITLGLLESGLESFVGYTYLVGGWGDTNLLMVPPKPLLFQPVCDALLGYMVQSFYIWRIWTFGQNIATKCICVFLATLSLMSFACAIAVPVVFLHIDVQALLLSATRDVTTIWLVSAAVVDIIISISMIIILQNAKSKTYFSETRDIISRLSRQTLQTGTLTSLLALAILFCFTQIHVGNMHTLFAYLLGKSYAMSLLANLNARSRGRYDRNASSSQTSQPSHYMPSTQSRRKGALGGALSFLATTGSVSENQRPTAVQIRTDRDVQYDLPHTTSHGQIKSTIHDGKDVIELDSFVDKPSWS
ncbi:hypothetical protein K439DRAFT_1641143 [Ramaria rubella]|nr:hypothetical protein K439DRAFT_1641143 [Ramaria rubella]